MACIDCQPVCGRASGSAVPSPITQAFSVFAFLGTVFGIFGKIVSLAEAPPWLQVIIVALSFFLVGLGIVALIWVTAYNQCNEEVYVATDKGIEYIKGQNKCIAGAVSEVKSDFTGFTMSWIAPWTVEHDRINVVVPSKFWDTLESNNADVFCTEDEDGRTSEYIRCYFYTDKVCKAATGSAIGATIGFILALPLLVPVLLFGVGAAGSCYAGIQTAGVAWPLFIICAVCIAFVVVLLLIVAAIVLAGAAIGGFIAQGISEATPATAEEGRRDTLANIQVQVGDLITVKGNMLIKEESDRMFHSLKVNVFWWIKSAHLQGVVPQNIPNNPFSYCDINDLFYPQEVNEEGQTVMVSHDDCSAFTNLLPSRCR